MVTTRYEEVYTGLKLDLKVNNSKLIEVKGLCPPASEEAAVEAIRARQAWVTKHGRRRALAVDSGGRVAGSERRPKDAPMKAMEAAVP